jgi:hypothetical protein
MLIQPKNWDKIKPSLGTQIDWGHSLARGLVGCWLFNEGGGLRAFDLTGRGNTGTLLNGATWKAGKSGSSLYLNGNETIVDTNNKVVASLPAITISIWIKPEAAGGHLVSNHYGCVNWESVLLSVSVWSVNSSNSQSTIKSITFSSPPIGEWSHLVAIWTGSGGSLYVYRNGNLIASGDGSIPSLWNPSANLTFGGSKTTFDCWGSGTGNVGAEFKGFIDEILIYNRALTATEIKWLYQEPFAMFAPQSPRFRIWGTTAAPVSGAGTPGNLIIFYSD